MLLSSEDDEEIMQDLIEYDGVNDDDLNDSDKDFSAESTFVNISHKKNENVDLAYGPHPKFSTGDEIYALQREFGMVTGKKVICSLDLLLEVQYRSRES